MKKSELKKLIRECVQEVMKDQYDPDEAEFDKWHREINQYNKSKHGQRFPCPTCDKEDALSAWEKNQGYQCNACADEAEGPMNVGESVKKSKLKKIISECVQEVLKEYEAKEIEQSDASPEEKAAMLRDLDRAERGGYSAEEERESRRWWGRYFHRPMNPQSDIILNVPFNKRESVKGIARWNPDIKKWWIDPMLIKNIQKIDPSFLPSGIKTEMIGGSTMREEETKP